MLYCPCGSENIDAALFCGRCGKKIIRVEDGGSIPAAVTTATKGQQVFVAPTATNKTSAKPSPPKQTKSNMLNHETLYQLLDAAFCIILYKVFGIGFFNVVLIGLLLAGCIYYGYNNINLKHMNQKQKNLLMWIVPVIVLVAACGIAASTASQQNCGWDNGRMVTCGIFTWQYTWFIWVLAIAVIGGFEWWMSKDDGGEKKDGMGNG